MESLAQNTHRRESIPVVVPQKRVHRYFVGFAQIKARTGRTPAQIRAALDRMERSGL